MTDPSTNGSAPESDERTFENALEGLEHCVRKLDTGDLPLEEALSVFERGVSLARECHEKLEAAEQRIEELTRAPGEPDAASPEEP